MPIRFSLISLFFSSIPYIHSPRHFILLIDICKDRGFKSKTKKDNHDDYPWR